MVYAKHLLSKYKLLSLVSVSAKKYFHFKVDSDKPERMDLVGEELGAGILDLGLEPGVQGSLDGDARGWGV